VAVASAGPYASLHLAVDSLPRQHPTAQFFTGRMPFLTPNQQRQSTEGTEVVANKCSQYVDTADAHMLKSSSDVVAAIFTPYL